MCIRDRCRDIILVRWKTFISFCSKFIQETVHQILSESPEFYRRYYKKTFWSLFFRHSVVAWINLLKNHYTTLWNLKCWSHMCYHWVVKETPQFTPTLIVASKSVRFKSSSWQRMRKTAKHTTLIRMYQHHWWAAATMMTSSSLPTPFSVSLEAAPCCQLASLFGAFHAASNDHRWDNCHHSAVLLVLCAFVQLLLLIWSVPV